MVTAPANDAPPGEPTSPLPTGGDPNAGIPPPEGPAAVQSNEQWMMRLNREGLPMCKDLHGLYTTMLISLSDRWPDWRYSLAFVLAAAVQRMQALQFVQIVRDSAGGMQHMLSLSQIKTSFIMSSETAWRICHAFVDACLLERLPRSDGDVYAPTPKGLHIVDRFVTRHGIATRSVSNLLNVHEVCDKMLFLERDEQDDVMLSDAVVRIVFHRLVGLGPDRTEPSALGVAMEPTQAIDESGALYMTARFPSTDALSWLVNYTTLVSMDEAAVLLAHMVRLGWLEPELHIAPEQSSRVAVVRIEDPTLSNNEARQGEFVEGEIYHVTEKGASVAWHFDWDETALSNSAPPRPPTSMSDAQKAHEMHAVSPRIDTAELYNEYTSRGPYSQQRAVSPSRSPLQHLSPYMGMSPLPNTSPLPGEAPLPKPSPVATSAPLPNTQDTGRAPAGSFATGLGLGLGPRVDEVSSAPQSTAPRAPSPAPRPAEPSKAPTAAPTSASATAPGLVNATVAPVPSSDVPTAAPSNAPASAPAPVRSAAAPAGTTHGPPSLASILHTPNLRRAFAAFLSAGNNEAMLQFWCEVEWFRHDCRVASSGAAPAPPVSDVVAELPARTPIAAAADGPTQRSALRLVLEDRARTRLSTFVTPDAAQALQIDVEPLAQAFRAYTSPATRAPAGSSEAARENEVQLAQLLMQCAAAQKQVFALLAERPRRQFLAARGEL
ncbi:AMSH/STAMBP protein ubiquitin specific-protease [Malassezia furfur]|uniref:AMSH/STAMBP protein ubiquitin specific-protease n=1 Tax=Malassezia furfur TaxID=55194 RepID=A0ABY8EMG6_MALFU|nr:SST2 [Malassezia furfur]WFD46671.1 AMSH/STAMBP protein ubiquitin specific-protease [Malassezia furfur]